MRGRTAIDNRAGSCDTEPSADTPNELLPYETSADKAIEGSTPELLDTSSEPAADIGTSHATDVGVKRAEPTRGHTLRLLLLLLLLLLLPIPERPSADTTTDESPNETTP